MNVEMFTGGAFAENAYLATCKETGKGVILDPGAAISDLLDSVEKNNVEVVAILLTHAHLDHIDGLAQAQRAMDVPVYLHPADQFIFDLGAQSAAHYGVPFEVPDAPDKTLAEGDSFSFGKCTFDVLETPGHAPGHVTFVEKGKDIAFVGDVVFAGSIGRTDLPGGDLKTLMESIRGKIMKLPDSMTLLSGHGPPTTVEHERISNPFLIPHYSGKMV